MGGMRANITEPVTAENPGGGTEEEAMAMVGILAKTHFIGADLPGLRRPGSGHRRIKGQKGEGHCFHVMSRLTGDVPMWDALEKEAMVKLLWKMSAFCGVEVLTYCVMGNHFHALVRVPDRDQWLREKFGAAEVPSAAIPASTEAPADPAVAPAVAAAETTEAAEDLKPARSARKSSTPTCGPCTRRTTWIPCARAWRTCGRRGGWRTRRKCWSRSGSGFVM